jgi:hypothetical protein
LACFFWGRSACFLSAKLPHCGRKLAQYRCKITCLPGRQATRSALPSFSVLN